MTKPLLVLWFVLTIIGPSSSFAEDKSKTSSPLKSLVASADITQVERFALHNSVYILIHEAGHLAAFRQDWPILGRWEDSADNFATYQFLAPRFRPYYDLLKDVALRWKLDATPFVHHLDDVQFRYAHSLDIQRAIQIVCLGYGANRDEFNQMARQWGLNEERRQLCQNDYIYLSSALERLLADPVQVHAVAEIGVNYGPSDGRFEREIKLLKDHHVLETVAAEIENYGMGLHATLTAKSCNGPGAWFDAPTNEIVLCYELIAEYFDQIEQHNRAVDE